MRERSGYDTGSDHRRLIRRCYGIRLPLKVDHSRGE
jgi:hypothetical protein